MLLHVPGSTDGGIWTDKLVEAIDVMPTLAEAAGLTPVPECPSADPASSDSCTEGLSLVPLISDPATSDWRNESYSQTWRSGRVSHAPAPFSLHPPSA